MVKGSLLVLALVLSILISLVLILEAGSVLILAAIFIAPFSGFLYIYGKGKKRGWWGGVVGIGLLLTLCLGLALVEAILSEVVLDRGPSIVLRFIVPFYLFLYVLRKGREREWWHGVFGFGWLVIFTLSLVIAEISLYFGVDLIIALLQGKL
jgi:hypothetical protein